MASRFARVHFMQTDISHAYAEQSGSSHGALEHCDLRDGRFIPSNCFLAQMRYSNLSSSNFQAPNFHRVNMRFVDLSASNLK